MVATAQRTVSTEPWKQEVEESTNETGILHSTLQIFHIENIAPLNTNDNILQRNLNHHPRNHWIIPKQTDYQKIGPSGHGGNVKD